MASGRKTLCPVIYRKLSLKAEMFCQDLIWWILLGVCVFSGFFYQLGYHLNGSIGNLIESISGIVLSICIVVSFLAAEIWGGIFFIYFSWNGCRN